MKYQLAKLQYNQNKESWHKSFLEGFCQDSQGLPLPWMTYPFIEFIEKKLQPHHTIFEFGSGSSTLFFAKKVAKVVAIESSEKWHEIMKLRLLEHNIKNVELIFMPNALTNFEYENCAANYAKNFSKFDFIIIDSLKRFECAKNSINAIKPTGAIVLDDSERKNYSKIFDFFAKNNLNKKDFFGIAPAQIKIKNTTIFSQINL